MKFGDLRIPFLKPSLTHTIISHMCHDTISCGNRQFTWILFCLVSFQRVGLNLVELLGTELVWEDLGLKYDQNDVCLRDLKVQQA